MESVLTLITITIVLAGILFLVLGLSKDPKPAGAGLAKIMAPSATTGFPAALVATTAIATTLQLTGSNTAAGDGAGLGAMTGLAFAILSTRPFTTLRTITYTITATLGTIATIIAMFTTTGCTAPGALGTWFTILLILIAGLFAAAGWGIGHTPTSPLAFFSALTVIRFLASPLGFPVFTTNHPALATTTDIIAAALFGFLAGRFPGPITQLAALAIALTTIAVTALIVPTCTTVGSGSGPGTGSLALLAGFTTVYLVIKTLMKAIRR